MGSLVRAEGDRPALEQLAAWLEHGPDFARVTGVEIVWTEPAGGLPVFDIRY